MKAIDIIIKPIVTEKATLLAEKKVYCFWVNRKSTKIDVKTAVKEIYGADADEVRMTYQRSKKKYLRKGTSDKRPEVKKAYVTLKNKAKLDLTKFEKESGSKPAKVVKVSKAKPESKATKPAKK